MKYKIIFATEILAILLYMFGWKTFIAPLDIYTLLYVLSIYLLITGYYRVKDYFGEK